MKNRFFAFLLVSLLFLPAVALAQLSLTTSGATVTIDFDNTVSGVNNGTFAGSGFQPSPSAGQLNSNAWAMTGWSDGTLNFWRNTKFRGLCKRNNDCGGYDGRRLCT